MNSPSVSPLKIWFKKKQNSGIDAHYSASYQIALDAMHPISNFFFFYIMFQQFLNTDEHYFSSESSLSLSQYILKLCAFFPAAFRQ